MPPRMMIGIIRPGSAGKKLRTTSRTGGRLADW
jgi:hypothetical protein